MRARSLVPVLFLLAACGAEVTPTDAPAETPSSTEVAEARPQIHYYTVNDT